jgi:HlyD family secretion protein
MWSRLLTLCIILSLVAAAAWALWPRPISVETASIAAGSLVVTVEEDGTSRISEVFHVSAPILGRLKRVGLHVGDAVTQGQTLASMEPVAPGLLDERTRRVAEAAVQAAAAGVTMAEAGLAQARATDTFAQEDLERSILLSERGLVSTQALQRARLAAETAQQSMDAAEATLQMHRQQLQSAQAALIQGDAPTAGPCCVNVVAPVTGRVLAVFSESEQVLQTGAPLMDIGDPDLLEVQVDVLSSDAVRIVRGARASIVDWGGAPLRAEVAQIDPIATTRVSALGIDEQRTRVTLRLLDGPETRTGLGHGYRVTAQIVVWEAAEVVLVPLGALFRTGSDWSVFVIEDGTARLRTLSLGQRNGEGAEVKDGLALGETVIMHPGDTLADGRSVVPEQ